MRRFPKIRLPLTALAALAVLLAGEMTLLALWCQPNRLRDVVEIFWGRPILIVLNALPVGLTLLTAAFLLGNVFYGAAVTELLVCALSIANRVKIQVRDEPVFPRDLALLREASSALENYDIHIPAGLLAVVALHAVLFAALGVLTGGERCPWKSLRGWRGRMLGAGASLAALWILIVGVLSSDSLYDSLGASNPYRLSVVFNENGFPYNFCRQFTKYQVDRPAGYSRAQAAAWDDAAEPPETGAPVNVVVVMNEAFSDITDDPAFVWTPEDDPLRNLHAVQADSHALSLRLVVPGFAGGTANTEFDVLTGMQTNALGSGTTSAMRTVNRNLDSLFRVFRADGFRTSFFHPGNDWFYNRENVYRWLGAERTLFIDEMRAPVYKGSNWRWVSDDYLAGLIETELDAAVEEGRPLFHYTTTIQNHMGYPRSKYGDDYAFPPVPLAIEVPDGVREMLEVYTEGVRDADAMLGRLRDAFAARPEPVVLVFYGDHLPYLGDGRLCYAALDMDIAREDGERADYFCIYETPCVIWANDAAAALLDWEAASAALDLPVNGKLSAAFLGAALLELTGRGRATAWTAFLNGLRRQVPVVQGGVWMRPDGALLTEADAPALAEEIAKWRRWSYYKLEQKELRTADG